MTIARNLLLLTILFTGFSCSLDDADDASDIVPQIKTSTIITSEEVVPEIATESDSMMPYTKMITPTELISSSAIPEFSDDMKFQDLDLAIKRQLNAFSTYGLDGEIILAGKTFPLSILKKSLINFQKEIVLVRECLNYQDRKSCIVDFNESIRNKFNIYAPKNSDGIAGKNVKYTAYYSPLFEGSKDKTDLYRFGIYKKPADDDLRRTIRNKIIFDDTHEGKDLELYYIKSIFDLYSLHLEGGGAVTVDGKIHYLSFAGHNSNKWGFIAKYMKNKGYISNTSVAAQKQFLDSNPNKWREIFSRCPGYIYFSESDTPPIGLENIPLTDNRSIAQDKKIYSRKGLISFVKASRPVRVNGKIIYKKFARFYLDQDTGSAIQGGARADIYFGFGDEAELAAHYLNAKGEMYYLISK